MYHPAEVKASWACWEDRGNYSFDRRFLLPYPWAILNPFCSETVIFTILTSRCYNFALLILFAFYANK